MDRKIIIFLIIGFISISISKAGPIDSNSIEFSYDPTLLNYPIIGAIEAEIGKKIYRKVNYTNPWENYHLSLTYNSLRNTKAYWDPNLNPRAGEYIEIPISISLINFPNGAQVVEEPNQLFHFIWTPDQDGVYYIDFLYYINLDPIDEAIGYSEYYGHTFKNNPRQDRCTLLVNVKGSFGFLPFDCECGD